MFFVAIVYLVILHKNWVLNAAIIADHNRYNISHAIKTNYVRAVVVTDRLTDTHRVP